MNLELIPLLISLIPALLITLLALYYFKMHKENEDKRRRFLLHRENQKESLPLRLQAYERMALFLERVNPAKLLLRVQPIGQAKKEYAALLINTIEQEFDHNLTQQIYMSDECWNIVKSSKNDTVNLIRKSLVASETESAQVLRETILKEVIENSSPIEEALTAVKSEVMDLL